jgi:uncharacterized tellurite resistance protein B-like protein
MFPTNLNQPQREGVFDLLLLGMYADAHLTLSEDKRLYKILEPYGWEGSRDPEEYAQLATARVRRAAESADHTNAFLIDISARLVDEDVRRLALGLLVKLIEADDSATESEADFYQIAKAAFGV